MTPLLVLLVIGGVVALPVAAYRRAGESRRRRRDHHRALDALGQASGRPAPGSPGPSGAAARSAHVRVVPSDAPEPATATRSISTWRAPRSPADPFRRPEPVEPERRLDRPDRDRSPDIVPMPEVEHALHPAAPGEGVRLRRDPTTRATAAPGGRSPGAADPTAWAAAAATGAGPRRPEASEARSPSGSTRDRGRPARARSRAGLAAAGTAAVVVIGGGVALATHLAGPSKPSPRPVAVQPVLPVTTTTLPAPPPAPAVRLVSSANGLVTYRLRAGEHVTVTATGPCWIEIRRSDGNGAVVFAATLTAGETRSLGRPTWIRIGNPASLQVRVGQMTLTPTAGANTPVDLLFH